MGCWEALSAQSCRGTSRALEHQDSAAGTHSCLVSVTLKGEALNLLDFRWVLPPDRGKSRLEELEACLMGSPGLHCLCSFLHLGQYSCLFSLPICLGDLRRAGRQVLVGSQS